MKMIPQVTHRLIMSLSLLMILAACISPEETLMNFSHLDYLTERIAFDNDTVSIVHIYANYPTYHWVDAKESGPEGIACVDDAARAAVLYLRDYELKGDKTSLAKATSLLKFVTKMQAEDGQFYNFIFADHSINREGKTSYKSFGWWAARGVWAMATGYRVMKDEDAEFASSLKSGVERSLPHVNKLLEAYGRTETFGDYEIPQWLLYESGADVVSELILGLSEYYAATGEPRVKIFIEQLADGLMVMQDGDIRTFPYGLHRSWKTMWHMWGNGQTQALATAGALLKDSRMIQSAEREAEGFYSRLLIEGFQKEMDVAHPDGKILFEQIAYAVRPVATGLVRLYEATGNEKYLVMAGLAASWFFGNNVLGQPMYDPSTGRCFDGIIDSTKLNRNSGAESTIEALSSLLEVARYPKALKFIDYRKTGHAVNSRYSYASFRSDAGGELTLAIDLQDERLMVLQDEESAEFIRQVSRE